MCISLKPLERIEHGFLHNVLNSYDITSLLKILGLNNLFKRVLLFWDTLYSFGMQGNMWYNHMNNLRAGIIRNDQELFHQIIDIGVE